MKITIETKKDGSAVIWYDRRKIKASDVSVELTHTANPVYTESCRTMERHAIRGPITIVLTVKGTRSQLKKRKKR